MSGGDVAVVVLAGGEGTRIGGGKPLRTLHGERLVDRALRQAAQWSNVVAVSVRDPAQVGRVTVAIAMDDPETEGPVGGLVAGLRFAREVGCGLLLTIPVDMPFLPADLLKRLTAELGESNCAIAQSGGRLHPVCALWRVAPALHRVTAYLASGRRSLRGLAEMLGSVGVSWTARDGDFFFNVNDRDGLAEAERRSDD